MNDIQKIVVEDYFYQAGLAKFTRLPSDKTIEVHFIAFGSPCLHGAAKTPSK